MEWTYQKGPKDPEPGQLAFLATRPGLSSGCAPQAQATRTTSTMNWLGKGSETTLRRRRDEWWEAVVAREGLDRRIPIQSTIRWRRDRPEPHRSRQMRLEVVNRDLPGRHPDRLGNRRSEPQRLHLARADPRREETLNLRGQRQSCRVARHALARRTHQFMALELRTATPQHRPIQDDRLTYRRAF